MMKKALIIILCAWIPLFAYATSASMKLHFINVGEGESILIEGSDDKNILIDTGNVITGINVLKYLKNNTITRIQKLIVTHPHPDHMGGIFTLLQLIDTDTVHDNNQDIASEMITNNLYRWYDELIRNDKRYTPLKKGDHIVLGDLRLDVLWPESPSHKNWNVNSLVMLLTYHDFTCLLMGDGVLATEKALIAAHTDLDVDILKAGHHGAADTGSPAFIKKVKPEIVVVSTDKDNYYGYPSPETLHRYKEAGAKLYTTFTNDTIIITVKPDGTYSVSTH